MHDCDEQEESRMVPQVKQNWTQQEKVTTAVSIMSNYTEELWIELLWLQFMSNKNPNTCSLTLGILAACGSVQSGR